MSRRRFLARAGSATLLLLLAAICLLWVRSYNASDRVAWTSSDRNHGKNHLTIAAFDSAKGAVEVSWSNYHALTADEPPRVKRFYHVESWAMSPMERRLEDGWRKDIAGFGMMHDFVDKQIRTIREEEMRRSARLFEIPMITESRRSIWMPHWFLVLVFGMVPMKKIYRWSKSRHRRKRGLCEGCGYDLRESSDACPECGRTLTLPSPGVPGEGNKATGETPVLRQPS
jgi:hypothetical protein